jgi:brefeldin A-inhibited guanine nucleotide-exchange protein
MSLVSGSGARRLNEARCRAAIQLLLVQASGEIYAQHAQHMPLRATRAMLDTIVMVADHARDIDADVALRVALAQAQLDDNVRKGPIT